MQQADEHAQHEQNFAHVAPQAQVVLVSVSCPVTMVLLLPRLQLKRTNCQQNKLINEANNWPRVRANHKLQRVIKIFPFVSIKQLLYQVSRHATSCHPPRWESCITSPKD